MIALPGRLRKAHHFVRHKVNTMIQIFRRFRSHIAASLLAAYSLYHAQAMVRSSVQNFEDTAGLDAISAFDGRFSQLREQLLQYGCREVGYVTDDPEDADWFTGYSRTQYALAPRVVDDSTEQALIVANLRDQSSIVSIMRNRHLSLVMDYGNGVVLLSRQIH